MSKEAVQQEQDFKVAMQQLSAEAEKVMPMVAEKNPSQQAGEEARQSSVLSEQLQALENSLLRRIESLATEMGTSRTDALNEHFKRIDEQLASIRGSENVNQKLFDSLHSELLKYRDNFLPDSLEKPCIHDLVYLYDHLSGLCEQLSTAVQEEGKGSRIAQWRDNLENAIHSLVEILHRFEVQEI